MAGKTNTDAIRDLEHEVSKLIERSDNDRRDSARMESSLNKLTETMEDTRTRLAIAEARLGDLRINQDELARRRWAIWLAVVGSGLTLVVNIALIALRR